MNRPDVRSAAVPFEPAGTAAPGDLPAPSSSDPSFPAPAPGAQAWTRQVVACALVFLLSARIPEHLAALVAVLRRSLPVAAGTLTAAALMVVLDAFGVLCALYFTHGRLRGLRLWRCYPPQRLIPLSLHFLGLLWGLLSLTLSRGGALG